MKLGYCYKQTDDNYSLTVDNDCIEIIKKALKEKIKVKTNTGEEEDMNEAADLLDDWLKLYKMQHEEE